MLKSSLLRHGPPNGISGRASGPFIWRNLYKSAHTYVKVDAGWSSPVARQAHNLKVAGSNPAPATKKQKPGSSGLLLFGAGGGFDFFRGLQGGESRRGVTKRPPNLAPATRPSPQVRPAGFLLRSATVAAARRLRRCTWPMRFRDVPAAYRRAAHAVGGGARKRPAPRGLIAVAEEGRHGAVPEPGHL